MKKIIFTRSDGGLSVMHPVEGARLVDAVTYADGSGHPVEPHAAADTVGWPMNGASVSWAETEDEFVARIAAKDLPPDAIDAQFVSAAAIPTDRTFRDAWKIEGDKIEHDMDKAREITRERLRLERAPLLAELDVQFMRALETGAGTADISAEKQRLRDVTDLVNTAATLDELRLLNVSKAKLRRRVSRGEGQISQDREVGDRHA